MHHQNKRKVYKMILSLSCLVTLKIKREREKEKNCKDDPKPHSA